MELTADNIHKRYGPFTALDRVSFEIASGERICLLGPNGSGKTTLLRILSGLSRPTDGSARVGGAEIRPDDPAVRERIGFVSHSTMVYEGLTARENLRFHARLWNVEQDRVSEVLEAVGLADRGSGLPREFSHGMGKRLALARALLDPSPVLLLDEPFSGLDQASTDTVVGLLEDRTVLLATHDFDRAFEHCDRVFVLDRGRMALESSLSAFDSRDDLRNRYQEVVE